MPLPAPLRILGLALPLLGWGGEVLQVRMDNLTVPPSTGPVVEILVRNRGDQPYTGGMSVRWPPGWECAPARQEVALKPGAATKVAFTIAKAVEEAANTYEMVVGMDSGGATRSFPQRVVVATSPVLKPVIDGRLDEWQDMVPPIAFPAGGRKTTFMTCYNRGFFCLAVRVEEDALVGLAGTRDGRPGDAIQFAIAPQAPREPADPTRIAHWEFVVAAASGPGPARAFLLRRPGDAVDGGGALRNLDDAVCDAVQAVVSRTGNETCYEVAVPLSLMPTLRPTTGRLFRCSLLVHDGDGTGLRDLGPVMNLERTPGAWSRWRGDALERATPCGTGGEFGFCTSLH